MASIQDVVNAAYRISDGAKQVRERSEVCASTLERHAATLTALVRGSRSGEEAATEVHAASRAVRECMARMVALQSKVDAFVHDATK